jgi:DNA-binding transcriptional LysR family regulator
MQNPVGTERMAGLYAFARAASLGSYTAASRALGVSPSAVSKSIQRLEAHLDVALFTRTTRSLVLTPEGRDVYERAQRLFREVEGIEQAVMSARREPAGLLKITGPLPIGAHLLPAVLPRFRARYPKLSIDLRVTDEYLDLIEEGIDVAIRIGPLTDSQLSSRQLGVRHICAYAAPDYVAKRGTPRTPADLANHDCIGFRYRGSGQVLRWPFRSGRSVLDMLPQTWLVVDAGDAVIEAVVAGGGIGMAASYMVRSHLAQGLLVPVLAKFTTHRSAITALWPASRRASPNVKALVSFLVEELSERGVLGA